MNDKGSKDFAENPKAFSRRPEKEYFLPKEIADRKEISVSKESQLEKRVTIFLSFIVGGFVLGFTSISSTGHTVSDLIGTPQGFFGAVLFVLGIVGMFLSLKKRYGSLRSRDGKI